MRFTDLVALAFSALRQQKVRTALTLLGVIIGTFVLLLSLSVGQGVRTAINKEWHRNDQLRRIHVHPIWRVQPEDIPAEELVIKGEMSAARRERLRQAIAQRWRGQTKHDSQKSLTPERLQEMETIEHVESVIPFNQWNGRVHFGKKAITAMTVSAPPDERFYPQRVVAGSFFTADQPHALVVSEYLLYRLGVTDEADVARALGGEVELEYGRQQGNHWSVLALLGGANLRVGPQEEDVLAKIAEQLPAAINHLDLTAEERATLRKVVAHSEKSRQPPSVTIRERFTLIGVLRDATPEETRSLWFSIPDADVLVPAATLRDFYFRHPVNREAGVPRVTVLVDNEDHVEAVEERIRALGFGTYSLAVVLKNLRLNVLLISLATTFVALVALVVAGLGITNTLLMSVLERTHEIGVMKAVGARDRHIQMLFLVEGAWIGLLGSLLGLLCGWLASLPGERIAHRLAEQQAKAPFEHSLFAFPWWLVLGVPAFVTLLTMLAAFYPARRAARVNPMTALRHE